jgi:acetyltransferase-like isoleucine patch superfamily enzyme
MIRKLGIHLVFLFYKIKLSKKVKFHGLTPIFISKDSKIEFGNNIVIKSSFLSNLVGLNQRSIIVSRDGGSIKIGNNVGISGTTIYSLKEIEIGNNVLIGGSCKIIDHDFHPLELEARLKDDRSKIKKNKIKIGDNCFIGTNSIILRGTTLGENCVIGAGSVVKGKFPDNCTIAGNPARVVKSLEVDSHEIKSTDFIELIG